MSTWLGRWTGRGAAPAKEEPAAPEAAGALRDEIRVLTARLGSLEQDLAERIGGLGQDLERAGRQQARATLALEGAQKAFRDAAGELREIAEVGAAPAREDVADLAESLRAEIASATALSLLPTLDSLDESERTAFALARAERHRHGPIGWREVARGAAEVALLTTGGPETAHTPHALERWAEGVSHTRRRLEEALARLGATPIPAQGHLFDPRLHRAIEVRRTGGAPPNTVVEVIRRGFLMDGRVIRYADVVVAKPLE